jgi:hypothetical protein
MVIIWVFSVVSQYGQRPIRVCPSLYIPEYYIRRCTCRPIQGLYTRPIQLRPTRIAALVLLENYQL